MRQIHAAIDHLYRGDFECAITLAADKPDVRAEINAQLVTSPEIDENQRNQITAQTGLGAAETDSRPLELAILR